MINPVKRFEEAKLKVQWAQSHVYQLIDQYRAILDSDIARVTVERDGKTGKQFLEIHDPQELPPMVALVVGDIVHNLRTAFDYVAIGATGVDSIALPVGRTRSDIVAKSNHYRMIKSNNSALADFIIDEIQPYHRGKFMLWELSELDRLDKHRLILPTVHCVHRLGMVLEDERGKKFENQWVTSRSSSRIRTLPGEGPFKIKHQGQSGVSVSFGPGTPFNDEPVLETLDSMVRLAPQAIQAFECFCFGKIPDPDSVE